MYFIGRIAEEVEPVFGLVECFGEEDKIRTIFCG